MNQWYADPTNTLSLDGTWEFSLNGQQGTIQVPGTWEAQGYPRRTDGPALFHKQVLIPAAWSGQTIQLQFDAVSYHVEAEVNGIPVGVHDGLWMPFAFDVTDAIRPGEMNAIRLTEYKPGERFPMRESLAGFLPDVCLPFGGLWQSARLAAFPGVAISDLFLLSDLQTGEVTVQATFHHADGLTALVRVYDPNGSEVAVWRSPAGDGEMTAKLAIDSPHPWTPAQPALYTAEICLENRTGETVTQTRRKFGFRTLAHEGDQLLLNGTPVLLRGVLNWGWYPDILCPAPDEATIRDEFRRVRELSYNMVKLCLHVPSSLYFDIADEEGMLLWLELPLWLPQVTERLRQQVPLEYADILGNVHHHPSIVIYSLGCELSASVDDELLGKLNAVVRGRTAGVLVCDNSGSGEAYGGLAFDYADFNDYHFYCDLHYFNSLLDHFRRDWRPARPLIFGEFCDVDDYRNLSEIAAAYGGELPWWLVEQNPIHPLTTIAHSQQAARMATLDLPFSEQDLQNISRQQSFVVRKTILEKVRARAGMGGYVVTGLRDTPLATSSLFDDLGRAKYPADSFRQFNADAVLLLEQGRTRNWKHGGDRPAPTDRFNHPANTLLDFRIVLANAGEALSEGELRWRLLDSQNRVCQEGASVFHGTTPSSTPCEIASLQLLTPSVEFAEQYNLAVELNGAIQNQWPLWIYPATTWPESYTLYDPAGTLTSLDDLAEAAQRISSVSRIDDHILLTDVFTQEVGDFVRRGGRAILLQVGPGNLPSRPCPFWRESIQLLYDHPVFAGFPHLGYVNLQFYHLANDYALDTARILTEIPGVRRMLPILRRLDARQFTLLDYLIEVELGEGKLLASSLRFGGGAGDQVSGLKANIAGRHLLHQMLTCLSWSQ